MSSDDSDSGPIDELYDEVVDQTEGRAGLAARLLERHLGYQQGVEEGGNSIRQIGIFNRVTINNSTENSGEESSGSESRTEVTVESDTRRGFLEKAAAGTAVVAAGAFGYETLQNSGSDIEIAEENIGSAPADYDLEIGNSEVIEDYVSSMVEEEKFSNIFRDVANDIDGETVSMGYIDDQNRVDFYGEDIVSSVEMSDSLYQEARDELDEVLQN